MLEKEVKRAPSKISVALLLTHGRSNRLFMTRHGIKDGGSESWGLIAGGVELSDPDPLSAGMREALEEANVSPGHVIFVRGRNKLQPEIVYIPGREHISLGLVFDVTYSGPKVPLAGWDVVDDSKVDRVELFSWRRVMDLLDHPDLIYRPEFNTSQLLRWLLMNYGGDERRTTILDDWLKKRVAKFPGLRERERVDSNGITSLKSRWEYIPEYYSWITRPGLFGSPERTNFARARSKWR